MNTLEKLNNTEQNTVIGENIPNTIFNPDNYKSEFVVFENNKFEDIIFDKVNLGYGVNFRNCTFNGYISFKGILVEKFDNQFNDNSESIIFSNCIFSERVYFGNNSVVQRAIVFKNCELKQGIEIDSTNITVESLRFEETIIGGKLDIFRSQFKQGISFISNQINTYLRINVVKASNISFSGKNIVSGNVHIDSCKLNQGITFNDGEFQDDVYFSLIETRQSGLSIIGSTFEKSFFINSHHGTVRPDRGIAKFYISESNFKNGVYIKGNEKLASATSPIVEAITINCSAKLTGNIVFSDLDVGKINLSGFNANATIEFKNIYANEFFIKSFTNNSGLILSSVNSSFEEWLEKDDNSKIINSLFLIDDSNLGKAQIYSVNFDSFDSIVIGNTTLVDVATSMIEWFSDNKLNPERLAIGEKRLQLNQKKPKEALVSAKNYLIHCLSTQKEVYRQIKVVNEKRGDIPLSLEFKRMEMIYLEKIVKLKNKWYTSESLILATSSFSNDFGQNWVKALGWLLLFSFITYMPIGFLTSENLDYSQGLSSCSDFFFNLKVVFWDNLKEWGIILNPAHRIADINKNIDKYSSWIFFWDLLSRVVISYFLFQMITAFRKYNK